MYQGDFLGNLRYYQAPPSPPEGGPPRSPEEIRLDIERRLELDPWVDEANVHVQVRGGVVTLTGEVDVANEKRAAGDDAWDTPGVGDVNNEVRIRKLARASRPRREGPPRPRSRAKAAASGPGPTPSARRER